MAEEKTDEFETTFTDYITVENEQMNGLYRFIIKVKIMGLEMGTFNVKEKSERMAQKKAVELAIKKWKPDIEAITEYNPNILIG